MSFYKKIIQNYSKHKLFALLIDPDKYYNKKHLIKLITVANRCKVDLLLIGGSIISNHIFETVNIVKNETNIPIFLFPGSLLQIAPNADGILLLSLLSGRNPEYLIGNHVIAAPILKQSNLEVISTGYLLVDTGIMTSVTYMSNTKPLPYDKDDIAVATAIAGELIGNKLIYLEAGSGAPKTVRPSMISAIKTNISIPLIVGGGINTTALLKTICNAGADIIVVGTAIEKNTNLLPRFVEVVHSY